MVLGSMLVHCLALSPCSKGFKSSGWVGALCVGIARSSCACMCSLQVLQVPPKTCLLDLFGFFLLAIGVNVRVNE